LKTSEDTEDPDIILNRGKCFMKMREFAKAHQDFDRILEKDPENPEYLSSKA
jgi:Tfp pilus assembly protein PilF